MNKIKILKKNENFEKKMKIMNKIKILKTNENFEKKMEYLQICTFLGFQMI